jgi:hypothetical protein
MVDHSSHRQAYALGQAGHAYCYRVIRYRDARITQAVHAERMLHQVSSTSFLPFVSIAALRARLLFVAPAAWLDCVEPFKRGGKARL